MKKINKKVFVLIPLSTLISLPMMIVGYQTYAHSNKRNKLIINELNQEDIIESTDEKEEIKIEKRNIFESEKPDLEDILEENEEAILYNEDENYNN